MSSNSKEDKVFNGGSIVEWAIARDTIELEADRQNCKKHLVCQPEDIVDGVVVEATFVGERICPKGQERAFVEGQIDQQIAAVRAAAQAKRLSIEALVYGNGVANALSRAKDLNAVDDREADDIAKLEQSKFKSTLDAEASGLRFDSELRQFDVDRAKAISILRKFLGPNPKNNIAKELSELRPRAAWRKLADIYASDAATASHLNNTTKLMSEMNFDKKFGDVSEHMGLLDKLNETLIAAGRGKSDAELLNYLITAMERSKDGAMYKNALEILTVLNKSDRSEVLETLRAVELKAKSVAALKGSHTIAGARFGKADVVAGANAASATKAGRNAKTTARRSKHPPGKEMVCVKCCKKGHLGRNCKVSVECSFCQKTNHCDRFCWEKNPSLRPASLKANAAKVESEKTEKDITKVTKK